MTRKEELTEKVRKILNALELRTQDQASLYLVDELLQVEHEIWEKASQRPYTVHTSHHSQDYCDGYVRASKDYAAWCREQRKEVDG